MSGFDWIRDVPSPSYVIDEGLIEANLKILSGVREKTGAKILLALKCFSAFCVFPLISRYLAGVCASGLDEARLGREEFSGEVHAGAPAFKEEEFDELLSYCGHVVFNSFSQWERFREKAVGRVSCGIRVNPEHSEVKTAIYDPCGPFSRLGVTRANFRPEALDGIDGLHFHTLCELDSDSLERTLIAFEEKFGEFLPRMSWVNMGGGHHITRPGYDLHRLYRVLGGFSSRHPHLQLYLEPGEAVALNAGFLVAGVLDIVDNGKKIAVLDTSAAAHMPDVLEMPYRPTIVGAGLDGEFAFTYRLAGMTCLAGDVIGDYSFPERLKIGDRLVFTDMAIYSMVKNNTFNGIRLPSIVLKKSSGALSTVRRFSYEDFRNRLS